MDGEVPGVTQLGGITFYGLLLSAWLIALGLAHPRYSPPPPEPAPLEPAPVAWAVQGTPRLFLRKGPPTLLGHQTRPAPSLGILTQGTRISRLSERALGGSLWVQLRVEGGPLAGRQGWVDGRYLHTVER